MKKLQMYLRANAAFSTFSGLVLILQSENMAQLMGIKQHHILLFLGIGLILFAITVFLVSNIKTSIRSKVNTIIYADISWVVGSMMIIIFQLFQLTSMGYILIAMVGLIVGFFALQQYQSLKER